jgi:hypothetical protein
MIIEYTIWNIFVIVLKHGRLTNPQNGSTGGVRDERWEDERGGGGGGHDAAARGQPPRPRDVPAHTAHEREQYVLHPLCLCLGGLELSLRDPLRRFAWSQATGA